MTSVRIVAIALALCACQALAQERAQFALNVVVIDQSGAVISGAQITAIAATTGARFEASTDANGRAALQLDQGTYEMKVHARGFMNWEDGKVGVDAGTQRTVTMLINPLAECGPCVVSDSPEIRLEYAPIPPEIPLIPMQQFVPPAKPLRRRAHWF
jgi:hypothetical protein